MQLVAWHDKAGPSHQEISLSSSQEVADTKLFLHAVHATNNGASSVRIYSRDTDVLVLAIRFPNLAVDTSMVLWTGWNQKEVPIRPIHDALGPAKAVALPGFYALTGADISGKFGGEGKTTCWKLLEQVNNDDPIVDALTQLGAT